MYVGVFCVVFCCIWTHWSPRGFSTILVVRYSVTLRLQTPAMAMVEMCPCSLWGARQYPFSALLLKSAQKGSVERCALTFEWQTHSRLFFAFSPPEYLWWYPVFNFPPHWPWGIFNAVAQHRLMLHCNSVSVSLCKRRVGFQRGENRWL